MAKDDRRARTLAARKVRRELASIDPSRCDQQRQSPLFGVLPPELRDLIFGMVLQEQPDLTRRYHYGGFDIGGFQLSGSVLKLHLDLLRTCQLVYYETKDLPLRRHSIDSFYPCVEIRTIQPGTSKCSIRVKSPFRFDQLTKNTQQQLREVHIITPSLVQTDFIKVLSLQQFTPRILNLTIGWRDIRGKYAKYAAPIRTMKFSESLEVLNLRIIDRQSSEEDLTSAIGANWNEWRITRKDERHLSLVQVLFEGSRTASPAAGGGSLCGAHLVWKLDHPDNNEALEPIASMICA